jgi:hypothetical protein
MEIIQRLQPGEDPVHYLKVERFNDIANDCYLFIGHAYDDVYNERYFDKKRIFLSLEEPNYCTDADTAHAKLSSGYGSNTVGGIKTHSRPPEEILTLCPYTAKLFENRRHVFFPFNEDYIPQETEKIFDVIYSGSIPANTPFDGIINVMSRYNYRYIHYENRPYITNANPNYTDKLILYAQSKIAVTHGLASAWPQHVQRYRNFPKSGENEAFKCLNSNRLPQFKSRVMEAAFSKTLIVNYRDDWNVIEDWFTPNEDFIYFSSPEELDYIIKDVLANPNKYQPIIYSAYNKAINNYTTRHFVEKYIGLK